MALVDTNGLSAADIAAVTGNNNAGGLGFGGEPAQDRPAAPKIHPS